MMSRAVRVPTLARNIATKPNNPLAAEHVVFPKNTSSSFGLGRLLHANIFRTNSVYVATVLLAAVVGTGLYDSAFQFAWEANNKGVSGTWQHILVKEKLYKDMISRYPGLPPNTEEEGAADAAAEEEEAADEE